MKISKQEVERVANLSRLNISGDEIDTVAVQLSQIMRHIDKLSGLDTKSVDPTSHALSLKNVFREDSASRLFESENPLDSAPKNEHGHYKVPKIIE